MLYSNTRGVWAELAAILSTIRVQPAMPHLHRRSRSLHHLYPHCHSYRNQWRVGVAPVNIAQLLTALEIECSHANWSHTLCSSLTRIAVLTVISGMPVWSRRPSRRSAGVWPNPVRIVERPTARAPGTRMQPMSLFGPWAAFGAP